MTENTDDEIMSAWNDLPDGLRCHPGLKRYHAAVLAAGQRSKTDAAVKPLFAVAVARKKWEELQDQGHRMQSLFFDGGNGGPGMIDAWGVVIWDAPTPLP